LEDVIVQKEPAAPLYCEHSFVTWRSPCLADAATDATPMFGAGVRAATLATMAMATIRVTL
jgi:hypothetical protein